MKVKLLSEGAQLPKRATKDSAGYDLYTPTDIIINPGRNVVPLNISICIPSYLEGQIRPRSGFSAKGVEGLPYTPDKLEPDVQEFQRYDADVLLGTIDSDYRGNVGVLIKSNETSPFVIVAGTRIAQLVLAPYHAEEMVECLELDDTERSNGGFGHTGTR